MKRALLLIASAFWIGCSDDSVNKNGADATADGGTADVRPDGLVLSITAQGDGAARYPYEPSTNEHHIRVAYEIRVQDYTDHDYQDLQVQLPKPEALKNKGNFKVESGRYNGALKIAERYIDWLSPDMGPIRTLVSIEADPSLFGADDSYARGESLRGEVSIAGTARIVLYDTELTSASAPPIVYYLPNKVAPQPFDFYSGQVDGNYLYVSGRTHDTPADAGVVDNRGGVFRIDLSTGNTEAVALIDLRNEGQPFWISDKHIYWVNFVLKDNNWEQWPVLYRVDKNSIKDTPELVPLPDKVAQIYGIRSNSTHIYLTIRVQSGAKYVYRFSASDPKTGTATSPGISEPIPDTMAITSKSVVVELDGPSAIYRMPLDLSTATKMVDTNSSSGRRSLACSETLCFWGQWNDGGIYQVSADATVSADGGAPKVKKLSGSNQHFLFDGKHLYSGINGLIRVGPDSNPPEERLFKDGLPPMLGTDSNYLYFGWDGKVWKLHK